ncbi:MAG TPA: hypothetical protein DDW56_10440 [Cyanobacteria bacterium UBA11366]|nr:hypothetical protein [Cyanobacteria bacterium UBA11366]HBK66467.1 hypothetical protein [Cyanobacteria bacterium UBA11166]HBS69093.1 hypothetical protein [Cyanobacteria bacterium UBA11153]
MREKEKQFIFYSVCPERVPKTKRRVLGEFLLRINYQQILGSFDLDFSDGEVRYKTSMSINNYSLTPAIILIRGVGGGEYVALFE